MKNSDQRKNQGKKFVGIIGSVLIIVVVGAYVWRSQIREVWERVDRKFQQAQLPAEITYEELSVNANVNTSAVNAPTEAQNSNAAPTEEQSVPQEEPEPPEEPAPLPAEMNLKVPFTSQAPHANWDLPYQEACEEAAALMVHYFFSEQTFTADIADEEITGLVAFENEQYGFYKDTTAEETARFIRDKWGYKNVTVQEATVAAIKQNLAVGLPVILPAAGRQLHNPNFSGAGPLYHMLVVKGYTKDGQFITNDPGTRRGENYVYDEDVLMNAVHDWNGGNVDEGAKVMLVVQP